MKLENYFKLLLVLFFTNNCFAQRQTFNYRVNFENDEFTLNENAQSVLKTIIENATKNTYYEITLTAHTDNNASNQYNNKLSVNRANAVKTFLIQNAIKSNLIVAKAFGEQKPLIENNTEQNKALNRRVDITLNALKFNNMSELMNQISPEYKQEFTINTAKQNIITGKNGTSFTIPPNSLVDENGKAIEGQVTISISEFLNPADAAFNNLTTLSNEKMLESGGMFTIKANINGQELKLKEGTNVEVLMPTINMQNGMNLYTAVTNNEGIKEWKPTTVPFTPKEKKKIVLPFVKLDSKYFKSLKVEINEVEDSIAYKYNLPKPYYKPGNIGPIPKYALPNPDIEFSWFERTFYPKSLLEKKLNTLIENNKIKFENRMKMYVLKKEKYEQNLAKYKLDSINFEVKEKEKLMEWANKQYSINQQLIEKFYKMKWNNGINKFVEENENNQLTMANIKANFISKVRGNNIKNNFFYRHMNIKNLIEKINDMPMANIIKNYGNKNELNLLQNADKELFYYNNEENEFASNQINENEKLNEILSKADNEIYTLRVKAGVYSNEAIGSVYRTSLSSFGEFNCDRFSSLPENQMANIIIPYNGNARVSFYIPKYNSYLTAYKNSSKQYEVKVPRGLEIKVIFLAFDEETGPLLQITKEVFKGNKVLELNPKEVNLNQIRNAIASI